MIATRADKKSEALRKAHDLARDLFLENPGLSIDAAARTINETCDRGLVKTEISLIRQEVRSRISHGANGIKWPHAPKLKAREPFNPPHFGEPQRPKLKAVESEATMPAKKEQPQSPPLSTKEERAAFLSDWAEKNPNATIADARAALNERFGLAMGTAYIADTLRVAKEIARSAQHAHPVEATIQGNSQEEKIEEIVKTCRALGILAIHIDGNDYRVERKGTLK